MYINKALVYGNLTRDPEIRALPSGQQVASFSLATNRVYKDKEGRKQEKVEYHNIVAFGRSAELIGQYMKKGKPLFVEGRLQTRSWESDGRKNYRTEIVVDNFQFGDGGRTGVSSASGAPSEKATAQTDQGAEGEAIQYPDEDINPEDIPF